MAYSRPFQQEVGSAPARVNPEDELLTPEDRLYLAGLEPQGEFAPQQFQGGGSETFAGVEGFQHPAPTSFGEGLLYGAVSGLGAAGSRVAAARAKFDESERQRHAAFDKDRLEASRQMRTERGKLLRDREKEKSDTRKDREKYEREYVVPTPDQLKAAPWIDRLPKDKEGRVRASDIASAVEQVQKAQADKEKAASSDDAVNLTPAGLDAAARMYATTGQLPAMGFGKASAGVRSKIINRAAEMNPNLNIASNKAGFQSNQAALTDLRKTHTASKAFEQTALKNATVLEGTLKKLQDTGSPWLNRPVRALANAQGDPDIAAFNAALRVVTPEFARLLQSPRGTGVLSDNARHEIESIMSPNATPSQIISSLNILRTDAHNRVTSYEQQIKDIEYEIDNGQPRPPLSEFDK